jgi:hypothetical protein
LFDTLLFSLSSSLSSKAPKAGNIHTGLLFQLPTGREQEDFPPKARDYYYYHEFNEKFNP